MRLYISVLVMLFSCVTWAIEPIKEYVDHPANSTINFEAIEIVTPDNYKLKSWICFPPKDKDVKKVLVLAYGDAGNMSYYVRQVLEVAKRGYTVVMFDYRGFGESQAFEMKETQLYYDEFVTDLRAVVEYSQKRFNQPVGVWALSMGTIASTLLYTDYKYDFLIAEGFVYSPQDIVDKLKQHLEKIYTLPSSASHYELALSKLTLPVLYFAGDRDGLTSPNDSYRAKYLNPKSEVVLYKGGHLQGFQALSDKTHGERYINALDNFFAEKKSTDADK